MSVTASTRFASDAAMARVPSQLAQSPGVSAEAMFSEDPAGRITCWNAVAERLCGCLVADKGAFR